MQPTTTTTGADAGRERATAELLDVNTVAAMLGCSARTIYRLADSGRLPRPIKLGALVRWNRATVLGWLNEGCPTVRRAKGGQRG